MAIAKSPLTTLRDALAKATPLKSYNVAVLLGAESHAYQGSPPRITLEPTEGDYENPADKRALADVDQEIVAHCWGADHDAVWDLHQRLLQGLDEQAEDGGLFWKRGDRITWDKPSDTTTQGVGLLVEFSVRLAVDRVAVTTGQVDAVSLKRTTKLTASMGVGDVTANVETTSGYPATGVLYIDSERITYAGLTGTSFTGLVRGTNGTAAAAHASGAAVSVTPT